MRLPRWLVIVLRVGLAAVFLYAAYTKLKQPWLVFALSISSYQILPDPVVLFMARTLPWFELALGLLLLVGVGLRYVSVAATGLLGLFFTIMIVMYAKGRGIDCGCFGLGEALGVKTLIRDGLLLGASAVLSVAAFARARTATGPRVDSAAVAASARED
jgi:uncharacterized membrane protein YphA (DoxX/SURF4 family)